MKEIKAYVRNNMVEGVIAALSGLGGVTSIAVVELQAYGQAAANGTLTMTEMTKLEIDTADRWVDAVVDCIIEHARTGRGHLGDGRVMVTELVDAIRIKDSARGEAILETTDPV